MKSVAQVAPPNVAAHQGKYKRVLLEWAVCVLLLMVLLLLDAHGPGLLVDVRGRNPFQHTNRAAALHHRAAVNTLSPGEVQLAAPAQFGSSCPLCTRCADAGLDVCPPCPPCTPSPSNCPACPLLEAAPERPNQDACLSPEVPIILAPECSAEDLRECQQRLRHLEGTECPPSTSPSPLEDLLSALKAMCFGSSVTAVWFMVRSVRAPTPPAAAVSDSSGALKGMLALEVASREALQEVMLSMLVALADNDRPAPSRYEGSQDGRAVELKPPTVLLPMTPPRLPLSRTGSRGAQTNVSEGLARHTSPHSARSVSPLTNSSFEGTMPRATDRGQWAGRPSTINSWLASQQPPTTSERGNRSPPPPQHPPAAEVGLVVNGGAEGSTAKAFVDDAKRRAEVAALSKAFCSLYQSFMHDMDQHWFARADALFAESRAIGKAGAQVKRAHDVKQREVDDLRKQLDVSSSAWAAKLADTRQEAEDHRASQEARHAEHQAVAARRIAEWEDRYAALGAERHDLSAALVDIQKKCDVLEECGHQYEKTRNALELAFKGASAELVRLQDLETQKVANTRSTLVQCDAVVLHNKATETSIVGVQLLQPSPPPSPPPVESDRLVNTAVVLHEALLRENREKHMAILEAKLLELDQRHHQYNHTSSEHVYPPSSSSFHATHQDTRSDPGPKGLNWSGDSGLNSTASPMQASAASSATPASFSGGEADPLSSVTQASRPHRSRTNQSDAYSQSVLRGFEEATAQRDRNALFDTLAMHHSGVSRRQSSTRTPTPFGSMEGWLQQHPYASQTSSSNKPRTPR